MNEADVPAPQASGTARAKRRGWLAVVCVLVVGVILTGAATALWSRAASSDQRRAFDSAATNITATLATMVGRDADFVATLRTVLTMDPGLGQREFLAWYRRLQGAQHQVGAIGSGVIAYVAADDLARFEARQAAQTAQQQGVRRWIGVTPGLPSPSVHYCLLSDSSVISLLSPIAVGLLHENWCNPATAVGISQAPLLAAAAATGRLAVMPVSLSWIDTTLLEIPFYRRGAVPETQAQRDQNLLGWVIATFDTSSLVQAAIGRNLGLAATLEFMEPHGARVVAARAGHAAGAMSRRTVIDADGTWIVTVRGAVGIGGAGAIVGGWVVLGCGLTVTLLLATLILALSRSRERALEMVADKTVQLRHQALHDPLTGLANRVLAVDRAEQTLARARRAQSPAAALYIDIDGFKHVNDTFGHAAGDALLRAVADRLRSVVREGDTAARLAGDEFLVMLDTASLDAAPELVAERLLEVLREPYHLTEETGRDLSLTASIGVAYGLTGSAEQLLADADVALYAAKEAGRDRFIVFESGMQTAAQDRIELEMDLADALAADELSLAYQPTFDLGSERLTGVEALLRWTHPTRGPIAPDVFIPIAERSGLIRPIGRWVLTTACRQAAVWRAQGHGLGVAVNVSGRQLDHDDLVRDVRDALDESGLAPTLLTIEITESSLMREPAASARRLQALKQLGVRIAIDDFGTGYSSLAYLRQFPVDTIKVDRAFVRGITTSGESAALVRTLIDLGRTLGLETLAEGIEDVDQLRALQRARCDSGQGFLLGRPMPPEALAERLRDPRVAVEGPAGAAA